MRPSESASAGRRKGTAGASAGPRSLAGASKSPAGIQQPPQRQEGGVMGKRSETFDPITMLAVYVPGAEGFGTRCAGFIMPRGKTGFEAFDAADRTLGIFPTAKSAAGAITEMAS
jgi:hypothetical protein